MKNFLKAGLYLSLAAILTVQCTKNEITDEPGTPTPDGKVTLTVRSEAPFSKTSLEEDGRVLWSEGDMIIVNGEVYEVVPDAEDPSFATIPDVDAAGSYLAAYSSGPLSGNIEGDNVLMLISPEQQYAENTFGQYSNPMVAYSESTELNFKNVGGIVRIGVRGSGTLKSISFKSNDDCILAGHLLIPLADIQSGSLGNYSDFETFQYVSGRKITINSVNGIVLDETEARYVYFVVPARTYSAGFSVVMETLDGKVAKMSTDRSITVNRSEIVPMEEFTFSPSATPVLEKGEVTATSIQYALTAGPDSELMVVALMKSAYDRFIGSGNYDDNSILAAVADIVETVRTDGSGTFSGTITEALNSDGVFSALSAESEYVILVAYFDGEMALGAVSRLEVLTATAEGAAPELEVALSGMDDRPYAQISFIYKTTDAASVSSYMFNRDLYEELASEGKTDRDMVVEYGTTLDAESLDKANSPEGIRWYFRTEPGISYVLVVIARGHGGAETVRTLDHTADEYLLEDDPRWKTISTTGYMQCGLFSDIIVSNGEPLTRLDLYDLTVQQLGDEDVFRIPEPFAGINLGFEVSGESTYIVLDARDNSNVRLESWQTRWENNTGLLCPGYETYGPIRLISAPLNYGSGSFGVYDPERKFVDFGSVSLYNNRFIFSTEAAPTYLYFEYEETAPREGASTENFTFAAKQSW